MAPLTRAHRAKASRNGEPIEPLSPALPLTSAPTPRRNHTRFDEDDTPTTTTTTNPDGTTDSKAPEKIDPREIADSQENSDASDSDDEAPEETSLGAGKEEAHKREEEARKAAEAQKEAARKKRKERDTQLKAQKASAGARKRQRLDEAASQLTLEASEATAEAEPRVEDSGTEVEAAGAEVEAESEAKDKAIAPAEKRKLPKLLPESLLAAVASRPEEDSDSEVSEDDTPAPSGQPSKHLERNRRRREQKRRNKVLKKGVVSVKVLSDDAAARKNLAPPVVRSVGNVKEAWLYNRRGGAERRAVGRGFFRK